MFITPSFKKSLIVEQFQGNYLKHFQRNDTLKNRSALRTYVGFRNTCGVLIRNGFLYQDRMLILFAVSLLGLLIGYFRLF